MITLMLVLVSICCYGFWPQKNAESTPGFDFYLPAKRDSSSYIVGLYDNTTIYIDTTLDGVYSYYTTINNQGTTSISNSYPVSSKVHATKPIIMTQLADTQTCSGGCRRDGHIVTPAQFLTTNYHIAYPIYTIFIAATQSNTNLLIDKTDDGTWDTNTTISPGTSYSYSTTYVAGGGEIKSDKPIVVSARLEYSDSWLNRWSMFTDMRNSSGTDFYVSYPHTENIKIVALNDTTTIRLDTNLDGIWDNTYYKNKSQTLSLTTIPISTHIQATNHIIVTNRYDVQCQDDSDAVWGLMLPEARQIPSECYVPSPFEKLYVTATQANTNILIDKTNDGVWDTNNTRQPGVAYSYSTTYVQAGSRIKTDKPMVLIVAADEEVPWDHDIWLWGYPCASATLATTTEISPSPSDFASEVNITSKVWNMLDNVYNLTISGSIPTNFTPWPNSTNLNITVGIYNTSDSLIAGTEELAVGLVSGGGQYNYTFSYQNTTLLSQLNQSNYIKFVYRATTPSTTGTFVFDQGTVDIAQATVWKYPWE